MIANTNLKMTAKAALCMALIEGRVLNVKNVFQTIGLTNASREIRRMVEIPFSVEVSRTPRKGKNKYGGEVVWIDYYLRNSEHNKEGRQKMIEYVKKHSPSILEAKTDKELAFVKQLNLL